MKQSLIAWSSSLLVLVSCGDDDRVDTPLVPEAAERDATTPFPVSVDAGAPDATAEAASARSGGVSSATVTIAGEECYTFDTDTVDGKAGCRGDVETVFDTRGTGLGFLSKDKGLCHFLRVSGGQVGGLAAVPRDYSACNWVERVAGPFFVGGQNESLSRHGLIVRTAGPHHYRVWVESDALPKMRFQWDKID